MDQRTGFLQFEGHPIAYASVRDGPLLVMPAWWVSHIVEDWSHGPFRHFVQLLAQPDVVEQIVFYGSYAEGETLGPFEARDAMVDLVRSA